MKNAAYHSGIRRSPYSALFGCEMRMGLASTSLPKRFYENIQTEEELEEVLKSYASDSDIEERSLHDTEIADVTSEMHDAEKSVMVSTTAICYTSSKKRQEIESSSMTSDTDNFATPRRAINITVKSFVMAPSAIPVTSSSVIPPSPAATYVTLEKVR